MVKALLAGRKTQTRRLIEPISLGEHKPGDIIVHWPHPDGGNEIKRMGCNFRPTFHVGQRLYVRERIRCFSSICDDAEITYFADDRFWQTGPCTGEISDAGLVSYFKLIDRAKKAGKAVSVPSIHMPRWASRLWLLVKDVRVERLQDISFDDTVAEGAQRDARGGWLPFQQKLSWADPRGWYAELWDSLHTKPGERWNDNPWLIAVTFEVHQGNIDAQDA